MAETPEFEFTLPEGVMGALHEAARQFQGASAGEGVASVRVAQAFALAAPVLADISAALAQIEDGRDVMSALREAQPAIGDILQAMTQIEDVYLRAELAHQANELLHLAINGDVRAVRDAASRVGELIQRAASINGTTQSRALTKEEKLDQLWGQIEQLNREIEGDLEFFRGKGYRFRAEDESRLAAIADEQEEIRKKNPNGWQADPQYLALEKERTRITGGMFESIAPQVEASGSSTDKDRLEDARKKNEDKAQVIEVTEDTNAVAEKYGIAPPTEPSATHSPQPEHLANGTEVSPIIGPKHSKVSNLEAGY